MIFEIKNRLSGEVLFSLETKSMMFCVEAAVKAGADLRGADLRGADLRGAYLTDAYLTGADLTGAEGVTPYFVTPLLMLLDQPSKIVAYKLVNSVGHGPMRGGIEYILGGEYAVDDANTNPDTDCGAGINLATLPWCIQNWQKNYRILKAEFTAGDIAAIPTATDGKFRVHRCRIVGEVDLVKIGLIKEENHEQ